MSLGWIGVMWSVDYPSNLTYYSITLKPENCPNDEFNPIFSM